MVLQTESQQEDVRDTAIIVPVRLNEQPIDVMIDTGADTFVVNNGNMVAMRISYESREDEVYGLCRASLMVCSMVREF